MFPPRGGGEVIGTMTACNPSKFYYGVVKRTTTLVVEADCLAARGRIIFFHSMVVNWSEHAARERHTLPCCDRQRSRRTNSARGLESMCFDQVQHRTELFEAYTVVRFDCLSWSRSMKNPINGVADRDNYGVRSGYIKASRTRGSWGSQGHVFAATTRSDWWVR